MRFTIRSVLFFALVGLSTLLAQAESCLDYEVTRKSVTEKRPSWWPSDERALRYARYERRLKTWVREQTMEIPQSVTWQQPNTGLYADEGTTVHFKKVEKIDDSSCSNFLYKTFSMNDSTVGFTIGRLPESCSESPMVIWYDKRKAQVGSARLIPMYNMNVETLWCVPGFTLFGLEAFYEGGGSADMLVIWHVSSNQWVFFQVPEKRISDLIPNWLRANAAAVGDTILLREGNKTITIRPFEAKWNLK
jgi:hypothetical protein